MQTFITITGLSLILIGVVVGLFSALHKRSEISLFCSVVIFVGLVLIFYQRVEEVSIKGVGTIKTAKEQAINDAQAIADIKRRIENQSATIDTVAERAAETKALTEDLTKKREAADEAVKNIEKSVNSAQSRMKSFSSTMAILDEQTRQAQRMAIALTEAVTAILNVKGERGRPVLLTYKIEQIERFRAILHQMRISDEDINRAVSQFDNRIKDDHVRRILQSLDEQLPQNKKVNNRISGVDYAAVSSWDMKRLRDTLMSNGIEPKGELMERILDFEYYQKTRRLRREEGNQF